MNRENVCMLLLVWWLKVRIFDRIDNNFGWICADAVCVWCSWFNYLGATRRRPGCAPRWFLRIYLYWLARIRWLEVRIFDRIDNNLGWICADAVPCVVASAVCAWCMIQTLALVVGLLIALSVEAINQLPIASVCDTPRWFFRIYLYWLSRE